MEELKHVGNDQEVHIELKSKEGPEGAPPTGKMVELRHNGICCDFGLRHTYFIPMNAIKHCYTVTSEEVLDHGKTRQKHAR